MSEENSEKFNVSSSSSSSAGSNSKANSDFNASERLSVNRGHIHPLSLVIEEATAIFSDLGFSIALGPEIEDEYHNFDALNIPEWHPARDMWDTFWLKDLAPDGKRHLLRTHTSSVQARFMESYNKDTLASSPIRIISPGRVFRYEATDATHEAQFYQIEGLAVGENISLADLKGTLKCFFDCFFNRDINVRFRPSYFPFVEPGVEIDISWGDKWLEVMGAGMVHPDVLTKAGIDPTKYRGFAFGGGIDRLAMLKYGIDDIRLLYRGDLRVINQF